MYMCVYKLCCAETFLLFCTRTALKTVPLWFLTQGVSHCPCAHTELPLQAPGPRFVRDRASEGCHAARPSPSPKRLRLQTTACPNVK